MYDAWKDMSEEGQSYQLAKLIYMDICDIIANDNTEELVIGTNRFDEDKYTVLVLANPLTLEELRVYKMFDDGNNSRIDNPGTKVDSPVTVEEILYACRIKYQITFNTAKSLYKEVHKESASESTIFKSKAAVRLMESCHLIQCLENMQDDVVGLKTLENNTYRFYKKVNKEVILEIQLDEFGNTLTAKGWYNNHLCNSGFLEAVGVGSEGSDFVHLAEIFNYYKGNAQTLN